MRSSPTRRFWVVLTVALAMAVSLSVAACEDIGGGPVELTAVTDTSVSVDTSTPVSATSLATTEPTSGSTATTLASTEEVLPSGHIKSMGYIHDVWVEGGVRRLSIDYCEFVYGDEATEAARADGEIGPTEEWDLDFYIRNQSTRLRTWRVSGSVAITTSTRWPPHDGMEASCSWSDFIGFFSGGALPDGDSHLHVVPWWIERDGDVVVKIDEQYLP